MKIVSACLIGESCRYDGKNSENKKLKKMFEKDELIPVCPEKLGGLSVPRESAEQRGDKVFTITGKDVTQNFYKGAEEVLKIAKSRDVKEAILKARSPSCGSGKIYDGTFSKRLIDGDGITTALLKKNGIKVISEEEL